MFLDICRHPRHGLALVKFRYIHVSNNSGRQQKSIKMDENILEKSSPDALTDQIIRFLLVNPSSVFFQVTKDFSSGDEKQTGFRLSCLKKGKTHNINYYDHEDRDSIIHQMLVESQSKLYLRLHPSNCLPLPEQIYHQIFTRTIDEGFDLNDYLVAAFGDPTKCLLRTVKLRNSTLTDDGLRELCNQIIVSLDIMYCKNITEKSLTTINENFGDSLKELKISGNWNQNRDSGIQSHVNNNILPMGIDEDSVDVAAQDDSENVTKSEESNYYAETSSNSSIGGLPMPPSPPPSHFVFERRMDLEIVGAKFLGSFPKTSRNNLHFNSRIKTSDLKLVSNGSSKNLRVPPILNTPKLEKLTMHSLLVTDGLSYFPFLFKNFTNLTHLDISNCYHQDGMDEFKWLPKYLKNTLVSLTMYNIREIDEAAIENLCKLARLKHLDISKDPNEGESDHYKKPDALLEMIIRSLPELRSLDISGTNLAGDGVFKDEENQSDLGVCESSDYPKSYNDESCSQNMHKETVRCDIIGLKSRCNNPLDFLGLYSCPFVPCYRTYIPAKEISGTKNERQLMVACQTCVDRSSPFPTKIFYDLVEYFKKTEYVNAPKFLKVILIMMKKHLDDENVQDRGLYCLFYIVRNIVDNMMEMNFEATKNIVDSALNAMFCHKHNPIVVKNACVVLLLLRKRNIKFSNDRYKEFHDYFVAKYELNHHERYQKAIDVLSKLMRHLEQQ